MRLCDLPVDVRLSAARRAAVWTDPEDREGLLVAAMWPSQTVYWVRESARPLLRLLLDGRMEQAA